MAVKERFSNDCNAVSRLTVDALLKEYSFDNVIRAEMQNPDQDETSRDRAKAVEPVTSPGIVQPYNIGGAGAINVFPGATLVFEDNKGRHRSASCIQREDEDKLAAYLQDVYGDDSMTKGTISPSIDDVLLADVYTTITTREDLEVSAERDAAQSSSCPCYVISGRDAQTSRPTVRCYRDLLYKNGILQKNVYVIGKAGSGKTSFCFHLVDLWSRHSASGRYKDAGVITQFRFVFFVACRHADKSDSVLDMIQKQLFDAESDFEETVRYVLRTKPEQCLIIVDGLDEWAGSPTRSTGPRVPCGLPDRAGLEGCAVITTSRPWRIAELRSGLGKSCRTLEIQGMDESHMIELIDKVLVAEEVSSVEESRRVFQKQVELAKMTDVVKTPLMLVRVLAVWLDDETLDKALCGNYGNMVDYLFQRAEGETGRTNERDVLSSIPQLQMLKTEWTKSSEKLPHRMWSLKYCTLYAALVLKLAHYAFIGLFLESKEKSLIFSMAELKSFFTETELEVSLKVGIFSIAKLPSKAKRRMVSVTFFHKSIQEFLAALWLVCTDDFSDALTVFTGYCQSLNVVFDLGVFIAFVCGLSPEKGTQILSWIDTDVAAKSKELMHYRQSVTGTYTSNPRHEQGSWPVICLQELLLECFGEATLTHGQNALKGTHLLSTLHDVHVDAEIGPDDRDLLYQTAVSRADGVKSLVVSNVKLPSELLGALGRMANLQRLHLQPKKSFPQQLSTVIATEVGHLSALTSLYLSKVSLKSSQCLDSLTFPRQLQCLTLETVSISDGISVTFSDELAQLRMSDVTVDHRNMEELTGWVKESSSLRVLLLESLECSECDNACQYHLDMTRHTRLEKLKLRYLNVNTIQLTPTSLDRMTLLKLSNPGAVGSAVACLKQAAPRFRELRVWKCTLSSGDVSVLAAVVPGLLQLDKLIYGGIHCGDTVLCVSPDMVRMKRIVMSDVFMSGRGWQDFASSLPLRTTRQLQVELYSDQFDPAAVAYISQHFDITRDDTGNHGDMSLNFVSSASS